MRAEYQFKQLTRDAKERYIKKEVAGNEIAKKC
jgi:putative endonuclease